MSPDFPRFSRSKFFPWFFPLFALWVLFVLVEFLIQCPEAWLSFPFSNSHQTVNLSKMLAVWGELTLILASSLWVFALMLWTGRRTLRVLGTAILNPIMTFCLEAGLGLFFWNLFWTGLGLTRLWFGSLWLSAMVLMTLAAVPDVFKAVKKIQTIEKPNWPWWFWGLLVVYGALGLFNALLPETFYDSLNYFLGLPQFWIYQHGISDNPLQLLSGYFYGGSMIFMGGWFLTDTEGATVFSLITWALCGVLAYGWAKELSNRKTAFVAAAAVLTFPLLYLNAWAVRVDNLFAFVSLLFLYALTKALENSLSGKRRQWLVLAALFAGLAVSIKPTALVMIVAAFLVLIARREKALKGEWVFAIFSFSVLGLLLAGPWLLKNWVFAGNPFFPYGFSWMGGRSLWAQGYQRLLLENRQYLSMDQGIGSILNLPWRLTMPEDGDHQMIGPLVLAFLPGLFLFKLKEPQKFLLWVMVMCFVLGFSLSHMLRFSMPAFMLAALLISVVLMSEESPKVLQWGWRISVWFFAVFFLGAYAVISAQYYQGWDRWTGAESREAYLERMMPNSYESVALWVDQNLPADARLLIVGDARGLYYRRFFYANSVFDEPFFAKAAREENDAGGILKRLHELGITHVIINGPEGLRLSADYRQYELTTAQWAKVNDLVRRGFRPLYWKNFQVVYEVKDHLSPEKRPYLLNLFSFLTPSAYDFSEALKAGDKPKARKALSNLLSFFPQEQYWQNQSKQLK